MRVFFFSGEWYTWYLHNYLLYISFVSFLDEATRVRLWPYPDIEGSDYINASFIDVR